jgi:deoxyribonuclease-1-like protein
MKKKITIVGVIVTFLVGGGSFLFVQNRESDTIFVPVDTNPITIGAFNIQIFGKAKREKADVMDVLVKTAQEFDVLLVQEFRDAKEETASFYLEKINEAVGRTKYDFIKSARLGRSQSKEAYAYYYNTEKVEVISSFVYEDTHDVFEREPYIASFRSGDFDFTLVGIHTKPSDATQEIAHLDTVVTSILSANPEEQDIIILGDLNADGSFFQESSTTNPLKAPQYHWLIGNDLDTMTTTNWTYDRIIMTGNTLNNEYVDASAAVFAFDQIFNLIDEAFIQSVSDHYPVHATFSIDAGDDD